MSHFKAKMHLILHVFPASVRSFVRVKPHLRDGRTDRQRRASLFVRPSLRWSLALTDKLMSRR